MTGRAALGVLAAGVAVLSASSLLAKRPSTEAQPAIRSAEPGVVGAAACARCHSSIHERWTNGRHSKMVQPATSASVRGDFTRSTVSLRGERYRLRTGSGQFFISESALSGREQEHRIEYTLGNRRIQHYLTTLENGWIVVLPPSWDIERQEWFHNLEIVRPEEADKSAGVVQRWNKNCFGCHVSEEEKNFDPVKQTYATRWQDFGTGCERCHGPGSAHIERYSHADQYGDAAGRFIVRPSRLDPSRSSMVCAQCHSLRDIAATGFTAGANYFDYFLPLLEYGPRREQDPTYWADGRTRRFSNDAIGLWQSECFLKGGATCITCHVDPHEPDVDKNPQLASTNERLCVRCHESIGRSVAVHTRHGPESRGSSCVECHMPKTVVSIKATIRDHAMSVPAPENTIRFGIPNACTTCHRDKSPQWAVDALASWRPAHAPSRLIRRAAAFAPARSGSPDALDRLVALAADLSEPPLVRANAVGYLRKYADGRAARALTQAMRSEEPVVRAVAALGLGEQSVDVAGAKSALVAALNDPVRTVRMGAVVSLVNLRVARLDGEDGQRFARARAEYLARARLNEDDPANQLDVGTFHLLSGELRPAEVALRSSLGLQPSQPAAKFLLALALEGQHQVDEARALLRQVPESDPYFERARKALARLDPHP